MIQVLHGLILILQNIFSTEGLVRINLVSRSSTVSSDALKQQQQQKEIDLYEASIVVGFRLHSCSLVTMKHADGRCSRTHIVKNLLLSII